MSGYPQRPRDEYNPDPGLGDSTGPEDIGCLIVFVIVVLCVGFGFGLFQMIWRWIIEPLIFWSWRWITWW